MRYRSHSRRSRSCKKGRRSDGKCRKTWRKSRSRSRKRSRSRSRHKKARYKKKGCKSKCVYGHTKKWCKCLKSKRSKK